MAAGRVAVRGRVEDRQPREQREVRHLHLQPLLGVLHHGRERHLRAGAGGGGDARERRQLLRPAHPVAVPRQAEEALPVADLAPVGEQHVGRLGRVHHGAAAHGEEGVGARLPGRLGAGGHHVGGRVLRHRVEHAGAFQPPVLEARHHPLDQAGGADDLVGDHERPARSLLRELEARALDQAAPRDHPRGRGELVEVLEARQPASAPCLHALRRPSAGRPYRLPRGSSGSAGTRASRAARA